MVAESFASFLEKIAQTDAPNLLMAGGMVLLTIALVGRIEAYINMALLSRWLTGILGIALLSLGVASHMLSIPAGNSQASNLSAPDPQPSSAEISDDTRYPAEASRGSEIEPNDSFLNAQSVGIDQPLSGSLEVDTDEDMLIVDTEKKSGSYIITISGQGHVNANIYDKNKDIVQSFNKSIRLQAKRQVRVSSPFYIGLTSLTPPAHYTIELKSQSD